jgi:phenylacetic acid degradation operon negative regulatory protein
MAIRRVSRAKKLLDIIEAAIGDSGVFCSYKELSIRLHHGYEGRLSQAINNLKRSGYLEIVEINNAKSLRLTARGRIKALLPMGRKRHKWDGRWRLIAFDIEEKRRRTRDVFRAQLGLLGFKMFQKSLWITPYDTSEEVEKLIDVLGLENNVDYFIADAVTNESRLINLFKLDKYNKPVK